MEDKKDDGDKDDKEKAMMDKDKKEDDKEKMMYGKGDDAKKSDEFSDVITSDYLNWMEDTLKSGGVDIDAARAHFDDVAKANLGSTPEELSDYDTRFGGQVKGRATENGSPSTNAIARTTGSGGKKDVKKSDFLDPSLVSESDVEAAYEVYKAAAAEQDYRAIQKSIEALAERIDTATTAPAVGEMIAKSDAPSVSVPSTEDLARMSWSEVHNLATRAFNPE